MDKMNSTGTPIRAVRPEFCYCWY